MKALKGKPVFDAIDDWTKNQLEELSLKDIRPTLGIIRVGQREDDLSYEKSVIRKCQKIGLNYEIFEFDRQVSNEVFLKSVNCINHNDNIHGILMFRPLPDQLDYKAVLGEFNPDKDIDGMLPHNLGMVLSGEEKGYAPCTAEAVVALLTHYDIPLVGANVSIVNSSNVVGKPLAMMLANAGATPTICHHLTKDIKDVMRTKDIVVSAIGKAKFFGEDHFSSGQFVVDVGINVDDEGQLCGDIDFDKIIDQSAGVTPVPGGIGGITTSLLLRNVVKACIEQNYNIKQLEVS